MSVHAASDVKFDFEGSLALMRQLWDLADKLATLSNDRVALANTALSGWLGQFADAFAIRANNDAQSIQNVITGLRQYALDWAACWLAAVNTQNKVNWAKAVDKYKQDEPWYDKPHDWLFGQDKRLDQEPADETQAPSPPNFYPTAQITTYTIT